MGRAGCDWFTGFLKRHPSMSIITPEATSIGRATAFNRTTVGMFYDTLDTVMDKHNFEAKDIWNVDETGITTVQKPNKIVATTGAKQVGMLVSAERGTLVTVCAAVSAVGQILPPFFVFPKVTFHDHFLKGAPVGSAGTAHKSGWMTDENFPKFLKHFHDHVRCSKESPVLILLDNHSSHLATATLDYAKENGIVMMSFPPHCSHKLQPLDLSVFGPLKKITSRAQQNWLRNHPGVSMTIYDIPDIVGEAWTDSVTPRNVTAEFVKAGVFPFNRDLFTDLDFALSSVTDRPLTLARSTAEPPFLPAAVDLTRTPVLATPATVPLPPMPDTTALHPTPDTVAIPPTQASALGRDGVQEHVTHIRVTDKRDSHPTAEPAHVSSQILEGTADQSIRNEILTAADLPGKIVDVRGDGQCIIHAAILCLQSAGYSITHVDLCSALVSEVITNLAFYDNFSTDDEDVVKGIFRLIFDKEYNTDTCDLLIAALSKQLVLRLPHISTEKMQSDMRQSCLNQDDGASSQSTTSPRCEEERGSARITQPSSRLKRNPVATSPLLLSRLRKAHPRAPPRAETTTGKRKRKSAAPVKNALRDEQRNRESRTGAKSTKRATTRKPRPVKGKKSLRYEASTNVIEDEEVCIVCLSPWSSSKSG